MEKGITDRGENLREPISAEQGWAVLEGRYVSQLETKREVLDSVRGGLEALLPRVTGLELLSASPAPHLRLHLRLHLSLSGGRNTTLRLTLLGSSWLTRDTEEG